MMLSLRGANGMFITALCKQVSAQLQSCSRRYVAADLIRTALYMLNAASNFAAEHAACASCILHTF